MMACEMSGECICIRERQMTKEKDCTVVAFDGDFTNSAIRDFVKYCEGYFSDKLRSEIRKEKESGAIGKYTKSDLSKIAQWQKYKCYFCFKQLYTESNIYEGADLGHIAHWDHLTPLSRTKGSNYPSNMALTCKECNLKKGNKTENEYWNYLRETMSEDKIVEIRKFHEGYRELKLALNRKKKQKKL